MINFWTIRRFLALSLPALCLPFERPCLSGAEPGTLLWEFETLFDWGTSAAIGSGNTVYVGEFHALDGATGTSKWEFSLGMFNLASPAIGPDGTVFVGTFEDTMYAWHPDKLTLKWKYKVGDDILSSPALGSNGYIYFGCEDHKMYAFNASTSASRDKIWEFQAGDEVDSSPAIGSSGIVYFGSDDGNVYALNGSNGALIWRRQTGAEVVASPAIGTGDVVYIGSWDGKVYALTGAKGSRLWEADIGDRINASVAIGMDGTVFVGAEDDKFYALDGSDGTKLWEFETGDDIDSSAAVGADGTVYFGSDDNKLYALDGTTGAKKWEFATQDDLVSSPVIGHDGVIYVTSGRKKYAIQGSSGPAESPWPMFGQNARRTRSVAGYPNPNRPTFTSPQTNLFDDTSQSLYVGTISAFDADGDLLGFHIIGGEDRSYFSLDSSTGTLTFKSSPASLNRAPVYNLEIAVNDGFYTTSQLVTVTVTTSDVYRDAQTFITNVRLEAVSESGGWYADPHLGRIHGTSSTKWFYQQELGYLYPEPDTNWFYAGQKGLGWLYMDDAHVSAVPLGNTSVLSGYVYSATSQNWQYHTATLAQDGSVVAMYYDMAGASWVVME